MSGRKIRFAFSGGRGSTRAANPGLHFREGEVPSEPQIQACVFREGEVPPEPREFLGESVIAAWREPRPPVCAPSRLHRPIARRPDFRISFTEPGKRG